MNITAYRLATSTGMQPIAVSEIIDGKRGITPETALKLGAFFEMEAEFWMNLQRHYELERTREVVGEKIIARVTPFRLVSSPKPAPHAMQALTPAGRLSSGTLATTAHVSVAGTKKPAASTRKRA